MNCYFKVSALFYINTISYTILFKLTIHNIVCGINDQLHYGMYFISYLNFKTFYLKKQMLHTYCLLYANAMKLNFSKSFRMQIEPYNSKVTICYNIYLL